MNTVIAIRKARRKDQAALESCFDELQSFEQSIEPNRADPQLIDRRYIEGLFADCAEHSGTIFVAEIDKRIVGFICILARAPSTDIIERENEYAHVTDLIVLAPYRHLGIGAQLMQTAEAHAKESGATRIRVDVLAANANAYSLYHKLGYNDNKIVLEKRVNASFPESIERNSTR